ncbi:MAG TPA: response regulator [Bacteriovoracaceae bacterium]|nr:response regulator [Bacteriovoracaceae bacterium]
MMGSKRAEDLNILVVDDEEKICELIKIFLESGFPFNSVVAAPNSVQATLKLQNQDFDLLIIDHVLPGKTGIDFVGQLRNTIKFTKLKVILVSAYLQQEDVLAAMDLGINHIMVKPFTRQQLLKHVSEILKITPL